ncbi:MAG: hypothetical protein ACE5FG_03385 [Myxococcota bacterium]
MGILRRLGLVLALLLVGGAINYERNADLDAELERRPYAHLPSADLEAMLAGTEAELTELRRWVGEEPRMRRTAQRPDASDLGGKLQAFERYQRETRQWSARRAAVLEREVTVEAIRRELSFRERGLDRAWRRVLRRALTL